MKTLYINRHAKSSWSDGNLRDFDRPLNNRGKRDAPFMAQVFFEKESRADLILSSPAKRAVSTAKFFAEKLNSAHIELHENIYEASVQDLSSIVNEIEDKYSSAIMFGHNPGFSYLVQHFTDDFISMPTCAIAKIEFDIDSWKETSKSLGRLVYLDYPKNHQ